VPYRIKSPFTHTRIGRRGACLLIFGFVPAMVGASLFVQPHDRHGGTRSIPVLAHIAPDEFWSAMWMGLGIVAMICAFLGWKAQRVGYLIGYALPLMWGAANFISWALGELVTGWISCGIYLGYCLLVIIISGWEEPNTVLDLREIDREAEQT
jgi:hypothetical protein